MDIENLKKIFEAHWDKATAIRMLSIDAVQKAKSGHLECLWEWPMFVLFYLTII